VGKKQVITGIGGLPGSGKSYYGVERIYESLVRGKMVYSNMRNIYIDKMAWSIHRSKGIARWRIKERFRIIETWDIENIWQSKIENAEIVLDEVMVEWLSRDWSKMDRRVILWFSQHRKFRVNFTYIAQSLSKVDGTLRDMTQTFILMKNTAFWRIGFLSFLKLPQLFLAVHFSEGMKDIIQREWIVPIKKYYGFYDSWAVFPSRKLMELEQAAESANR